MVSSSENRLALPPISPQIRSNATMAITDSVRFEPNPPVLFIQQFVKDVADFSSQYGSNTSISYTAYNIAGNPSKFPDYGDFPQTFVMVIFFIALIFTLQVELDCALKTIVFAVKNYYSYINYISANLWPMVGSITFKMFGLHASKQWSSN